MYLLCMILYIYISQHCATADYGESWCVILDKVVTVEDIRLDEQT